MVRGFKGLVARVKWSPRCRNYRGNETTTPANNVTNTAQTAVPKEGAGRGGKEEEQKKQGGCMRLCITEINGRNASASGE